MAGLLIYFLNGRNIGIFNAVGYNSLEMDTLLLMQKKRGKMFCPRIARGEEIQNTKEGTSLLQNMDSSSQLRIKGNKITRNDSFKEFTNKYNIQWIIDIRFLLP